MKSLRIASLLFCATVLPQAGGELFAQLPGNVHFVAAEEAVSPRKTTAMQANDAQANEVRLGYCNERRGGELMPQGADGQFEYGGMVRFDKELLAKYAGCSIDSVVFRQFNVVEGSSVAVFVTDDSQARTFLSRKVIYEYGSGWNGVQLPKSVKIVGNTDLYVGYLINVPMDDGNLGITFDSGSTFMQGCNFYGTTNSEGSVSWYLADAIGLNVSIRAFAEGSNIPQNDAGLFGLSTSDLITQNNEEKVSFAVRNYGANVIESVDVELKSDDAVVMSHSFSGLSIASNEEATLEMDAIAFEDDGNHVVNLLATKVNGVDDSDAKDNVINREVFVINENAVEQPRKVLVELFGSEYVKATPDIDEIYGEVFDAHAGYSISVCHHMKFQARDDQFVKEGDEVYTRYFDIAPDGPFLPAVMVDRLIFDGMLDPGPTYFAQDGNTLAALIEGARYFPSYINVLPSAELDGNALKVRVEGVAQMDEMPFQDKVHLNVYLVEDKVASTSLLGYDGTYYHDGIIRMELGAIEGEEIDLSSLSYSKEYQAELKPEWNVENMRIVAFVSSYSADCVKNSVYNAAELKLKDLGGVSDIEIDGAEAPGVWYNGQTVKTDAGRIVSVCDVKGAEVSGSALVPGFYIVTVETASGVHTSKLIVR